MPRRELRHPRQVEDWLIELNSKLTERGELILIGSGGLLWHASQKGINEPLPENSMDVDPITNSEEVARHCYDGIIGSEFEAKHGWHINLMPDFVLREFPANWKEKAASKNYGLLTVVVPTPEHLLIPKRKRNEPRDRLQEEWARSVNLI